VIRALRPRSLKNKLALIFCAITAVATAAVWFYVVPQLQSTLQAQKRNDLARVARATSEALNGAAARDFSGKHLDELVRAVSDTSDARVTLYALQRSHGRPGPLWLVSDSAAQQNVNETTALAAKAARQQRVTVGYGHLNGERVAQTASQPPTTQAVTTTQPTTSTPTTAPKPQATTVAVTESEFKIVLASTSFKAGKITFDVKNTGKLAHDLAIKGGQKTKLSQPGGSAQLAVTLKPGKYHLYCTVPGHEQAGMKADITVS